MGRRAFGTILATLALAAPQHQALAQQIATAADEADAPASAEGGAISDDGRYDVAGLVDTATLVSHTARNPARTAYAAPLIASQDTCMGSRVSGGQAMGLGLSVATTWIDTNCRRLKNARELAALGFPEAAMQLLCMDDEVYAAMERAGTPCPGVQRINVVEPQQDPEITPPLMRFDDVLFDFDRATLRPEADTMLAPVLAMLQAEPDAIVDIEGHTDWMGSDAYNQRLSQRRAEAVVDWLVARGIDRARLNGIGKGERQPVATNLDAEGRQLNRRLEVRRR